MKVRDRCLLACVALVSVLALLPVIAATAAALTSSRSSRLLALLARLPEHPQLGDIIATRETRDEHVEQACSGWVTTLAYCSGSPSPEASLDCVCSEAALDQLGTCGEALAMRGTGILDDFSRFCAPSPASPSPAQPPATTSAPPKPPARANELRKKRRRILQ